MAIRKFRKHTKPFIWFITILFVSSSAILAFLNMKSSYSRINTYAFKLNGEKISKLDVEKTKASLVQGYSRYLGNKLDRDLVDVIAFDDVINRSLTLKIADDLNVKVSNGDVNSQYTAIENSIGNKEQFRKILVMQGYTKKSFKNEIKNNMLIEKTYQKIQDGITPTDEEIQEFYNDNKYTTFNGKALDEVRESIVKTLKEQKGMESYLALLEQGKNSAKIEDIAPEYENLKETVAIDEDGFKVTNVDLAKRTLNALLVTNGDKQEAEKQAKDYYEAQIKVAKEAMDRGLKVESGLPVDYQLAQYQKELYESIKDSLKPSEEELKAYFEKNSLKYDTFPSAEANIAVIQVEPSASDKAQAKAEAESVLKQLTVENFKDKAKEYSHGPSAGNGGELGWFSKGDMVEPFQKAVFEGKVGEIYPTPVETVFGYHLIYIEDRNDKEGRAKASHILITPKVSAETVKSKLADVDTLKNKLEAKEVTFENITKGRSDILQSSKFKINNAGYISGLGYNDKLAKDILDAPLNKIEVVNIDDKIYIFDKLSDVKYKKADFQEVKDRVREDYLNSKTQEEMKKYI